MAENREKTSEALPETVWSEEVKTADPRAHSVTLDALRGLGILGVVVVHSTGTWVSGVQVPLTLPFLGGYVQDLLLSLGWGLALFFLLSGYLLTWTEENRARRGAYSLRSYVVRRALRMVPAYYVAIVVVFVTWPVVGMDFGFTDLLWHATFLQTLNPYTASTLDPATWYLTSEVAFYCLLPLIVLKLKKLSQRLTLFGVLFLIAMATHLYIAMYSPERIPVQTGGEFNLFAYLELLPSTHLYLFMAGVLLRMLIEPMDERPSSRSRSLLALALFAGSSFLILLVFPELQLQEWPGIQVLLTLMDALTMVAFFASALLGAPILRGLLRWRALSFVGMISYSLYLFHMTVLVAIFGPFLGDVRELIVGRSDLIVWAAFSAYLFGVLAVAGFLSYLGYRYIESPFLRYKPK